MSAPNFVDLPHNVLPELYAVPEELGGQAKQPLGHDRQTVYDEYVNGCIEYYNSEQRETGEKEGWRCWLSERDRIAMNLRQPQSMVNYTRNVSLREQAKRIENKIRSIILF